LAWIETFEHCWRSRRPVRFRISSFHGAPPGVKRAGLRRTSAQNAHGLISAFHRSVASRHAPVCLLRPLALAHLQKRNRKKKRTFLLTAAATPVTLTTLLMLRVSNNLGARSHPPLRRSTAPLSMPFPIPHALRLPPVAGAETPSLFVLSFRRIGCTLAFAVRQVPND
jgi:hypothetical protein